MAKITPYEAPLHAVSSILLLQSLSQLSHSPSLSHYV